MAAAATATATVAVVVAVVAVVAVTATAAVVVAAVSQSYKGYTEQERTQKLPKSPAKCEQRRPECGAGLLLRRVWARKLTKQCGLPQLWGGNDNE